jgi:predicted enzyme related to lactoylglutathione lyase
VKTNLDFVLLHVADLAAARAFYTEMFGLEVEDENAGFIQFRRPAGAMFALEADAAATAHAGVELWWEVENAEEAHAELTGKGVGVVGPLAERPFGRVFAIADPAGNTLNLMQLRRG